MKKNRLLTILGIVVAILLIPLIAMQFTTEIYWELSDFLIMGIVLFTIALVYELIARKSNKIKYRIAFGIGLLAAFLLFWIKGAVGIIGNEGQTVNVLYILIFVVGLSGALLSRFKAKGMYKTMLAAALTQMLVPVVALFIWPPANTSWSPGIFGVFVLNSFFALLFIISALLFKTSSN